MWFKNGLKAQKPLAQGIALGIIVIIAKRPLKPRAMPWARSFWAFSPFLNHMQKFSIFINKQVDIYSLAKLW